MLTRVFSPACTTVQFTVLHHYYYFLSFFTLEEKIEA